MKSMFDILHILKGHNFKQVNDIKVNIKLSLYLMVMVFLLPKLLN